MTNSASRLVQVRSLATVMACAFGVATAATSFLGCCNFAKDIKDATEAPGTADLKAKGCRTAMVMDAMKVAKDIAPNAKPTHSGPTLVVTCSLDEGKSLTCDDVATTYVKSVGRAAAAFTVAVSDARGKQLCSESRNADGTPMVPVTK